MPPKRKASALDTAAADPVSSGETEAESTSTAKRPRVSKTTKGRKAAAQAGDASGSAKDEDRSVDQQPETSSSSASPKSWSDVVLEGEDDDGGVTVYDDCNEIRRKIRLLQKEPSFKITHWLKDIGNINSNSFQRFMKAKGANGGASNGTYYAAYVFFEKKRIFEGKKKTPTRIRNESAHAGGFELQERRYAWIGPA